MISFIVIGKNIESTVEICIRSIQNFIAFNKIKESEIVYVDSDSNDRTIDLCKKLPTTIIQIKGEVNAAIGRNVGAKKSKGEILFFVDGDMELIPEFYPIAFENEHKLKHPFVTGDFLDKFYDENFNPVSKTFKVNGFQTTVFMSVVGGLFIVERPYWEKLNGMDERLIRSQDFDFGLRMEKAKCPNLRYHNLLAYHHTKSYYQNQRLNQLIYNKGLLSTGILVRKHIFNYSYLKILVKSRRSLILFIISIMISIVAPTFGLLCLSGYLFYQVIRSYRSYQKEGYFWGNFKYKLIFDLMTFIGFLFYFPAQKTYAVHILQ